ncbi:HAD-IA family hydrolase [Rheinheimera soli]|uniref:Phosphoglycolate phosphatase n=1 Tax=Rheinheimera soli TaxID=443616 RepID=A0ABU1W230_9GAMM|nr:HAD-IA family hydrolase [Rheinheimera soli]MDR7122024.1 phosphoglycolate phosphatase [Rheinheimera soli]
MSSDIALVVFDWDGTVMDSVGRIVSSMRSAAELSGLVVPTEHQVKQIIGLSLDPVFDILFPGINATERQTVFEHYRDQYLSHEHPPTPLFAGAEQVMRELQQQGVLLAVATGKARKGLKRMFEETGLESYFSTSRCADEAESKPSPDMLKQILAELKLPAHRAIMVGDTIHDMAMAQAIEMPRIGVTYGVHGREELSRYQPKAIIDSLPELLKAL